MDLTQPEKKESRFGELGVPVREREREREGVCVCAACVCSMTEECLYLAPLWMCLSGILAVVAGYVLFELFYVSSFNLIRHTACDRPLAVWLLLLGVLLVIRLLLLVFHE